MALRFIGIDPDTPGGSCPSVWVDDETGEFVIQGWRADDEPTLAQVRQRSPILADEAVVRLPARMAHILRTACDEHGTGAGDAAGPG